MPKHNIGSADKFPVNKGVCVEVEGKRIAVFNTTGQYYAINDTCPHKGASLSEGAMNGMTVICPWHGAEVDVRTGMAGPPSPGPVQYYEVSSSGTELFLEI